MPHYECALADEQHGLPSISPFKNKLIAALSMKSNKNLFPDADTFVLGRSNAFNVKGRRYRQSRRRPKANNCLKPALLQR